MNRAAHSADVCLVLEGTYPYVAGGVSTWTHDLIRGLPGLSFHILTLMPPGADLVHRYELPDNVVAVTPVTLQRLARGRRRVRGQRRLLTSLRAPIEDLVQGGGAQALARIIDIIGPRRHELGQDVLLDSREAWQLLVDMYSDTYHETSFLDYFWSWRALMGGLFSLIVAPMPRARVYHTVSTGYAGLFAARARIETGRPAIVTEHGIYTNERRIEIAMADWLFELPLVGLGIDRPALDLKDFWIAAFEGYSRACYDACDEIITLYEGNQAFQIADGADPAKLAVVPNGIDFPRFSALTHSREGRAPTIALIGRVVPIKDVKSYLRAVARLRESVPELRALVMGPTEEDEEYYEECVAMVEHLGLGDSVSFTGRVRLDDYLGGIDVIVLTSISEAQPLVLLEAGAVGIPSVATDVGSCREILFGRSDESPPLGAAGAVVRLSDPEATAQAVARLLLDAEWYAEASAAIRERVRCYYQERDVMVAYGERYARYIEMPDAAGAAPRDEAVA
ncbi:MAG: GT4 family glycosyltransferase PelF [Gammaproteobacteria bacterium]|nr:GT4 family glycosyltransferase PelF [Gammaproteobacteria bacterium]MCP5200269.1 GT4 family glycosyltransferase PelF [Gammaproteobacteria bacterium]